MDIADLDDEYVLLAQKAVEGISVATVPGVYWVEHFPFLRHIPSWVPGTFSKKMAEHYKPTVETMRDKPFDKIKQDVVWDSIVLRCNSTILTHIFHRRMERRLRQ